MLIEHPKFKYDEVTGRILRGKQGVLPFNKKEVDHREMDEYFGEEV